MNKKGDSDAFENDPIIYIEDTLKLKCSKGDFKSKYGPDFVQGFRAGIGFSLNSLAEDLKHLSLIEISKLPRTVMDTLATIVKSDKHLIKIHKNLISQKKAKTKV